MKNQNLDQYRAKNALTVRISEGGGGSKTVAKKVPTMIRENGFIAAMAFAKEYTETAKKKAEKEKRKFNPNQEYEGKGYADVFNAIIMHLRDIGNLHDLPDNFDGFLAGLCQKDSVTLRAITAESMAYLNYLRRFQG